MTAWLMRGRYAPPVLDALLAYQVTGSAISALLALAPLFGLAAQLHIRGD